MITIERLISSRFNKKPSYIKNKIIADHEFVFSHKNGDFLDSEVEEGYFHYKCEKCAGMLFIGYHSVKLNIGNNLSKSFKIIKCSEVIIYNIIK